eukprot:m.412846 g.412846  ORF g.412846 m.412846 type:complete len:476 (-) comp56570_c0_seq3:478-1905(-)
MTAWRALFSCGRRAAMRMTVGSCTTISSAACSMVCWRDACLTAPFQRNDADIYPRRERSGIFPPGQCTSVRPTASCTRVRAATCGCRKENVGADNTEGRCIRGARSAGSMCRGRIGTITCVVGLAPVTKHARSKTKERNDNENEKEASTSLCELRERVLQEARDHVVRSSGLELRHLMAGALHGRIRVLVIDLDEAGGLVREARQLPGGPLLHQRAIQLGEAQLRVCMRASGNVRVAGVNENVKLRGLFEEKVVGGQHVGPVVCVVKIARSASLTGLGAASGPRSDGIVHVQSLLNFIQVEPVVAEIPDRKARCNIRANTEGRIACCQVGVEVVGVKVGANDGVHLVHQSLASSRENGLVASDLEPLAVHAVRDESMPVVELNLDRVAILAPGLAAEHRIADSEALQVLLDRLAFAGDDLVSELRDVVSSVALASQENGVVGELRELLEPALQEGVVVLGSAVVVGVVVGGRVGV